MQNDSDTISNAAAALGRLGGKAKSPAKTRAARENAKARWNRAGADVLHMTLHRQWFDQIAAGTKKIEYRDRGAYWDRRLDGPAPSRIKFVNGYGANRPWMLVECIDVTKDADQWRLHLGAVVYHGNFSPDMPAINPSSLAGTRKRRSA